MKKQNIMLNGKVVLITGVAGFIGSNLVHKLLCMKESVNIIGIDNMNDYYDVSIKEWRLKEIETVVSEHPGSSWKFIKGNIADKELINQIFEEYKPAVVIIDGKRVENDYTFVADDEEMKVEISYTFNASALGGKNLVTFEELYDFSNPDEPVKVAEHKDIEDDGQTVLITERIIKIHTTATDKDGNKELEAGKDVTFIDTVTLEGLEVGTQYKLVGWQMLREENAELLINGKRVENLRA